MRGIISIVALFAVADGASAGIVQYTSQTRSVGAAANLFTDYRTAPDMGPWSGLATAFDGAASASARQESALDINTGITMSGSVVVRDVANDFAFISASSSLDVGFTLLSN